jgi:hypothetical protein
MTKVVFSVEPSTSDNGYFVPSMPIPRATMQVCSPKCTPSTIIATIGRGMRFARGRQTVDAVNDEKSVIFTRKQQAQFQSLRDIVDSAIAAGPAVAHAPTIDPMDQLRKLAELRDSGVVTEAEFQAKKRQLLGN